MTLRKKLLGSLAALIVIAALIVAGINVTTKPTFLIPLLGYGDYVTFPVVCHAIGPGLLNNPGRSDGSVDLESQNEIYEGMSAENLETYVGNYESLQSLPLEQSEQEAYRSMIQERTTYYCSQLRENQQTGLMLTFGVSLLLLLSVGVAAIVTEPRRTQCRCDPDAPSPKMKRTSEAPN